MNILRKSVSCRGNIQVQGPEVEGSFARLRNSRVSRQESGKQSHSIGPNMLLLCRRWVTFGWVPVCGVKLIQVLMESISLFVENRLKWVKYRSTEPI